MREYLHEHRRETLRILSKRLNAGVAAGDVSPRANLAAVASYYATLIHGISVQARDGASRASLLSVVDCAMAAWDSLTNPPE